MVHVDNVGVLGGGDGETWEEKSYETEPDRTHVERERERERECWGLNRSDTDSEMVCIDREERERLGKKVA